MEHGVTGEPLCLAALLFYADGIKRVGLRCETEGDVLAVEFDEAGFRQRLEDFRVIAFPADVREDQMFRVRGQKLFQGNHCLNVAEMAEVARNAPFRLNLTFLHAQHLRVVIGFQHEQIAPVKPDFCQFGDETEVGGIPYFMPGNSKSESHGRHVVRNSERFNVNAAEIEVETGLEQHRFFRHVDTLAFEFLDRFRDEVRRDAEMVGECSASAFVHVIAVGMRDYDRLDGCRLDTGSVHSSF